MARRKRPEKQIDLEPNFDLPGLHIYDYEREFQPNGVPLIKLYTEPEKRKARVCPYCDSRNVYSNGFYHKELLDLPMFRQDVTIDFEYQQYKCKNCGKLYQDEIPQIARPGIQMTNRLREAIARDSLRHSFQKSAEINGITNATAKNIFDDWCKEQDENRVRLKAPRVLGIDEAHLGSGKKDMRGTFIDVEKGLLLDITVDREVKTIKNFIESLEDYKNIKIVTMDMYNSYRSIVYEVFGSNGICIVADRFHVIQDLNKKAVQARKLIVEKAGHPKLGNNSDLMKINLENLLDFQKEQLFAQFAICPELAILYGLKESFRTIYNCKTRKEAEEKYKRWCESIPDPDPVGQKAKVGKDGKPQKYVDRFAPIRSFKKTVDQWHREVFNYFDSPFTNAATETINGLIKIVNRNGRGYEFNVLRHKLIYGLHTDLVPTETVYIHKNAASDIRNAHAYSYVSPETRDCFIRVTRLRPLSYEECLPNIAELARAVENGQIYFGEEDLVDEDWD